MSEQSVQAGLAGGCGDRAVGQPIGGRSASVSRAVNGDGAAVVADRNWDNVRRPWARSRRRARRTGRSAPDRADRARGAARATGSVAASAQNTARSGPGPVERQAGARGRRSRATSQSRRCPAAARRRPASSRGSQRLACRCSCPGRRPESGRVRRPSREERPGAKRSARRCWSGMHADQGAGDGASEAGPPDECLEDCERHRSVGPRPSRFDRPVGASRRHEHARGREQEHEPCGRRGGVDHTRFEVAVELEVGEHDLLPVSTARPADSGCTSDEAAGAVAAPHVEGLGHIAAAKGRGGLPVADSDIDHVGAPLDGRRARRAPRRGPPRPPFGG